VLPVVDDDDDEDVQWQTDTSMRAAQRRIQEQLNAVTSEMVMLCTHEEKPFGKKSHPHESKPKIREANGTHC